MFLLKVVGFWFLLLLPVHAQTEYRPYVPDHSLVQQYSDLFSEFENIVPNADMTVIQRQYAIIRKLLSLEPAWKDGYWAGSGAALAIGNLYANDEKLTEARNFYETSKNLSQKCLQMEAENPICQLFLAGAIGKLATLDGILESAAQAQAIEALLLSVVSSGVNYRFRNNWTLQGLTNYALGLFYRLVPDTMLMEAFFNVRGDVDKSVKYHKRVLSIESRENPCTLVMTAVSLLCKSDEDYESREAKEGFKYLEAAANIREFSKQDAFCFKSVPKLFKDPTLSCAFQVVKEKKIQPEEG